MTLRLNKKLFTVQEYYKMAEVGIISPDDRVELIKGEIIKMSPTNSPHASVVNQIADQIYAQIIGKATIRIQSSINIFPDSQPEPDLIIARKDPSAYYNEHPNPKDIFLLIEVANSSLEYDRTVKASLYASAGITQYWIINLVDKQLEQYSKLKDQAYQEKSIIKTGKIKFPNPPLVLDLAALFSPADH